MKYLFLVEYLAKKFPIRFKDELISVGQLKIAELQNSKKTNINYYYTAIKNAMVDELRNKNYKLVPYYDNDKIQEGFFIQIDLADYLQTHYIPEHREIIMYSINGHTYTEIEQVTNTPKSEVHRIIAEFRVRFKKDWVD